MADLSQIEWKSKLQQDSNAVVLDVRTEDEVAEGIIPNAINADIYGGQEFIDTLKHFDKDKHYFVYCKSGGRSAQACAIMKQMGFKKAYNLVGGITSYTGEIIYN